MGDFVIESNQKLTGFVVRQNVQIDTHPQMFYGGVLPPDIF